MLGFSQTKLLRFRPALSILRVNLPNEAMARFNPLMFLFSSFIIVFSLLFFCFNKKSIGDLPLLFHQKNEHFDCSEI
jgi:hypothetical protein